MELSLVWRLLSMVSMCVTDTQLMMGFTMCQIPGWSQYMGFHKCQTPSWSQWWVPYVSVSSSSRRIISVCVRHLADKQTILFTIIALLFGWWLHWHWCVVTHGQGKQSSQRLVTSSSGAAKHSSSDLLVSLQLAYLHLWVWHSWLLGESLASNWTGTGMTLV